jgi:hypothetical protein
MTTSRAGSCRPAYPNGFMLGLDLRVASRAREATGQPPGSYTATTPARSCRSQRWRTRRSSIRTVPPCSSTAQRSSFDRYAHGKHDRRHPFALGTSEIDEQVRVHGRRPRPARRRQGRADQDDTYGYLGLWGRRHGRRSGTDLPCGSFLGLWDCVCPPVGETIAGGHGVGWSGPNTRTSSASSCLRAVAAPAESPACNRQ